MLTQRTIGKLQTFLEAMFSRPPLYDATPALDAGSYYRLLYEENVRPELLDLIGRKFDFLPSHTIRALHEGLAIRHINREVDHNYSVSTETEREIGDIYVLVFAAAALRRYSELIPEYQVILNDETSNLLSALQAEGFRYRNGQIFGANGNAIKPVPFDGGGKKPDPLSAAADENRVSTGGVVEQPSPTIQRGWSRGDKIAIVGVLAVLFGAAAAWLIVPEVRRAFHLDKASSSDTTQPVAIAPETGSNIHIQGQQTAASIFSVSDAHEKPVAGADILVIKSDGKHLSATTNERGAANLEESDQEPVTVFCAHPGFSHYASEKVILGTIFKIELRTRPHGGSVIFPDGTGYVPGLDGRLNPMLDTQGRTYLYAENVAIEGGEAQPVSFTPNRPFNVRDQHGNSFELDIINIIGNSSLIDYTRR